ncbi:MAG: 2-oxoglutarate dehydrogenase E1 component [Acidobacteria bacterium SCN 69-37]|nr:MAG: 2-oxoglutarate dehydrogenase E1 component [Acidobacteria bacterium SCN 69-37]
MSLDFGDFQGVNEGYVLELYDRYVADPQSVDAQTRERFRTWTPSGASPVSGSPRPPTRLAGGLDVRIAVGAISLAECIRRYGHLAARIDPLGSRPRGNPLLLPAGHGITADQLKLLPAALINEAAAADCDTMFDLVEKLRGIYCGTTGYDIAHIFVPEERLWLRDAIETGMYRAPKDPIDPVALLDRLTDVEVFEKFLHRTYPGKTRFSIEGVDMLVPILDEVLSESAEAGLRQAFIGMAHRGRLNVMAHVMGKPYEQILAEFRDPVRNQLDLEGVRWAGDVKYHLGASRMISGGERVELVVSMPPNPSHLESIDPVLVGMARAAGTDASKPGAPTFNPDAVLPILIHGDAAFPGQGVVAETLNLHQLDGYSAGGTIHIITNNQIGFTTDPSDSYSTLYASGLARGYKIPIFHVNADDPEACVEVARLALGYRMKFRRDVLIDLVGYRRYGHNEGDEPAFTQPKMYGQISQHPTAREMWARTLETRGMIEVGRAQGMVQARMERLQKKYDALDTDRDYIEPTPEIAAPGTAAQTRTAVPAERLAALGTALLAVPSDFHVHRKLERVRERRRQAFASPDERSIDWATAEDLAYASILEDGTPIRLTGEDVGRGTFSHRHAVLHDAVTGQPYVPLQAVPQARASFEIHNSPLTELATIGFEYGYDIQAPERLVIWEAQYGDFINGAQLMLDEFVLSARAKWGQEPALVLLLPHGHEGQGPDHASGRPERFLQLAADINMRVANCTTAAQFFHLLRRQAALLIKDPLPLIVMTPKSLLRHPFTASTPRELAEGRWQEVIDDADAQARRRDVRRLIFCSGKVAVDLFTSPHRESSPGVAICRVEQLYPLPVNEMVGVIENYPNLEDVLWVQEEPENMGAWEFVRPQIEGLVGRRRLAVLARPRSSSPAEGSAARHAQNQERLVTRAFEMPVESGTGAKRAASKRQ